ncbi:MAG: UDP-N-acetylglucosamine 1-carboxyvinyltransferase, partial [Rhodanobacter sp.]
TATLEITGVDSLSPTTYETIPDRIVAGTWAVAAAITGGDVTIHNAQAGALEIALDKLVTSGAHIEQTIDGFRVSMDVRPRSV